MKKTIARLFSVCFLAFFMFSFVGCGNKGTAYTVTHIVIDSNNEAILKEINDATLEEHDSINYWLENVGNKIIRKDNKLIFDGLQTKDKDGSFTFNENVDGLVGYNKIDLHLILGGTYVFDDEIHIYVTIDLKLSYLIYKKNTPN